MCSIYKRKGERSNALSSLKTLLFRGSGSGRPTLIKITRQGDELDDLYLAEVTTPHETWKSPDPIPGDELGRELLLMGYDPVEIRRVLKDAGVGQYDSKTRMATKEIRPLLKAALAGEREVPEQEPHTEAWLAYALPKSDVMLPLIQVISNAEFTMDGYPTPNEISWAFLRLRKRGWLVIEGEMYGLTPEAKRIVKEIENDHSRWPSKLVEWMSEHPLPGDE